MTKRKPSSSPRSQARSVRGASVESLRVAALARKTPEGQADRVVSYDLAAVRAAIEAQTCPICGNGPYKVLAVHTNKAHGVDKYELRDMAGLTTRDSICAPEFAERAREVRVEMNRQDTEAPRRSQPHRKHRFTAVGLARSRQNLVDYVAAAPEDVLAAQRASAGRKAAEARWGPSS